MTTTPTTSKGEQAKSQLIAAAIAQFGEYGLHATTRDIAAQAGQNIAAITYYFGSKDDLYLACAQWIADFIEHNFRPHAQAAEALCAEPVPDKAAMRTLILGACQNMILLLTQDDTVNLSKFISREQLSPTPALTLTARKWSSTPTRCWAKFSLFALVGKRCCAARAGLSSIGTKPRKLLRLSPAILISFWKDYRKGV